MYNFLNVLIIRWNSGFSRKNNLFRLELSNLVLRLAKIVTIYISNLQTKDKTKNILLTDISILFFILFEYQVSKIKEVS